MTDLQMAMAAGAAKAVDDGALRGLKELLRGDLITPDDPRYDEARRVNNGMHDRRPASIVRAADVADVMATVRFARDREVMLAVRGGGHSAPGFGTIDGGMVLDLGRLRGVRVDPARRRVRVEGGSTWGDVDHATHAFGLAVPAGIVSTTGVGGLTLGGGMGYLSRRCGLTVDNLLEADVVTAAGELLTCSEKAEPDLFWALRGGGGNFGVVTSFVLRLHPIREIYGGPTFYELDGGVLRAWRDFIVKAPAKLGALCGLTLAPPLPFLPAEWHGKPVVAVIACWSGALEEGEKRLKRLPEAREGGRLVRGPDALPGDQHAVQRLLPPGLQQYWKGCFARELGDAAIEPTSSTRDRRRRSSRARSSIRSTAPASEWGRRHGVSVPRRRVLDRHRRRLARPRRQRAQHRVGASLLRRARALLGGGRLRELHGARGPGASAAQLPAEL